jgi:CO dehydrogenase maturation factor
MGRPEGQGCYCAANHLLRTIIDSLGDTYKYIVVDNEAGMEHISRRTTRDVDMLLNVSDPTIRGIRTAESISNLAEEIEVNVHQKMLVLNRVAGELPEPLQEAIDAMDLQLESVIPADPKVNELDALGKPLTQLTSDSPAFREIETLIEKILRDI